MNRRLHRTLASLRWSLLATLALGLLGLLAGEPVASRHRDRAPELVASVSTPADTQRPSH